MTGRSIRTRMALIFVGLSALSSLTLVLAVGVSARRTLRDQVRQRLMVIAASGALSIEGDELARLTRPQDETSPTYLHIRECLRTVRDANDGIRRMYVLRPGRPPATWTFVVDTEQSAKPRSRLGEPHDVNKYPELAKALKGPSADRKPAHDKWGFWISGYAPIKDSQGRSVAIVGAAMSAGGLMREEQGAVNDVAIAALLLLVLSSLLAQHLSETLSRPIVALAEATERIANGDLFTEVEVGGPSEIVSLGRSFNAMTEALREHREQLVEMGNTDFLTSLHNHRYFQERLEQEIGRAARYHHPLSLVLLDIDHFRQINALYGHQGGDDLLRQVAQLIRGSLRDCDVATRYGGEEFAIILPETSAAEALSAAERARVAVENYPFQVRSLGGLKKVVRLTISGGLAEFPGDSREKDGLVLAADVALLRAKHMLRNSICRFAEDDAWPAGGMDPAELHWALQDASVAAVESLAQALDARDHYTRGHSENVTRISVALAQAMGMPKDELSRVRVAGLLHDIGKIGIPDRVLLKPGALSREEWQLLRAHPSVGADILAKAPMLTEVIPIVLGHHERYDGTGYPKALAGEDIPLAARILAVADSFDAMTSDRPYRRAMGKEQAMAELRACSGSQFDPAVVAAFETIADQMTVSPREPVPSAELVP